MIIAVHFSSPLKEYFFLIAVRYMLEYSYDLRFLYLVQGTIRMVSSNQQITYSLHRVISETQRERA